MCSVFVLAIVLFTFIVRYKGMDPVLRTLTLIVVELNIHVTADVVIVIQQES